jgi:predicted transcriptional regulator
MSDSENKMLAENKVLILYVLEKINKDITNGGLFKIISSTNNINYFYFQQTLNELIQTNLVGSFTKDEDTVLKITSEGKNKLSLTKNILPGILKLKANTILKDELIAIEEEQSIITEYIPKNEKDYTVKCKIVENNEIIFEVRTFAGSNERAKKISDNWKKNATSIYPKILALLLDEE